MLKEYQKVPLANLNPSFQMLREHSPIRFNDQMHMWQVFRYEDIQKVLIDPGLFSSNQGSLAGELIASSLLSMDPPRHRQLHGLASQAFSPRRVQQMEQRVVEITNSLLDEVVERGTMDLIEDFAFPLPTIVIAELLGVPAEDRDQFKLWSDAIVREIGQDPNLPRGSAQDEMVEYLRYQLKCKRERPGNDLISALAAAEQDGERLSDHDIVTTSALVLIGGHETTTNLIGNTFLCLMENPEALKELYADRSLIPSAVEESLRYWSPLVCTFRVATRDTEINGQAIKAGEYVQLFLPSANRDATIFPDADRFDIRRTPNRHMAFSYGIHYCLGAPLARLEGNVSLRVILERCANISFPEQMLEPLGGLIIQGVRHLPINFTPMPRPS